MTEEQWLACTDPRAMLAFLGDRFTQRKSDLLARALTRSTGRSFPLLDLLRDEPGAFFNEEAARKYRARLKELRALACGVLRDLFNPYRAVQVDPAWLLANDGIARHLAEGIDEQGAVHRLPILADALEDAGCDSAELLEHLRGPGPHVRGCWAVDLLMGRR